MLFANTIARPELIKFWLHEAFRCPEFVLSHYHVFCLVKQIKQHAPAWSKLQLSSKVNRLEPVGMRCHKRTELDIQSWDKFTREKSHTHTYLILQSWQPLLWRWRLTHGDLTVKGLVLWALNPTKSAYIRRMSWDLACPSLSKLAWTSWTTLPQLCLRISSFGPMLQLHRRNISVLALTKAACALARQFSRCWGRALNLHETLALLRDFGEAMQYW